MLLPLSAQTSRKIRNLKAQRTELQKQIAQSEQMLVTMKKNVKSQLSDLAVLNGQIAKQQQYVKVIENDVKTLEAEIQTVEKALTALEADIQDKRQKYERSMKYAYRNNRTIQDKLMFVLSANTITQMFRRMRYVREYTTYLKVQGEQLVAQQQEAQRKRSDLLAAKGEKTSLLRQGEQERSKLESKQEEQKKLVADLQKKQKGVQKEIEQKRKQSASLNAQIDRLVEQEIAAARRREEERRKKEEAWKREEARKRKEATVSGSGNVTARKKGNTEAAAGREKTARPKAGKMDSYRMDNEDRLISGGFERNKGRMSMPITGAYVVVGRYGSHAVAGLSNVRLDNKGIDIKGQAGACARAIFEGEVSAIFSYAGVKGVLVRHGKYISVYCNLASVNVRQGQKVKARETLGRVANGGDDGYVLHFQLRRETAKLDPEAWLHR